MQAPMPELQEQTALLPDVVTRGAAMWSSVEHSEVALQGLKRACSGPQVTGSSASMDLDMLKEACGNFSFRLTAVEAGPQQQPQQVLPQTISSGFAGSAFGPAAGLPLDPLPANVPRPVVNSGAHSSA